MANNIGTIVAAPIVTPTTNDNYGTHYAKYGIGGFYSVADIAERDAITTERRELGLRVEVRSEDKTYRLINGITNANWEELDYSTGQELPYDFFISTTPDNTYITYKTDTYRTLDLQPLVGVTIIGTNEVFRDPQQPNNLIMTGNFVFGSGASPAIVIVLENCKIVDNELTIGRITSAYLPTYRIHGSVVNRGFLYVLNRPDDITMTSTLVKINPYDLSDYVTLSFPATTEYIGNSTDLLAYKNKLYALFARGGTNGGYLVEIDEDLQGYRPLFSLGLVSSSRRLRGSSPFLIHNDEIYTPNYNNATAPKAYNSMGVTVYDFKGNIKREVNSIDITSGFTQGQPLPHWMGIFNNKLIITNIPSGINEHTEITRWDCTTLSLEEVKQTNLSITDDNSIFSDGYVYLNGEANQYYTGSTDLTPKLIKVKYNNFNDWSEEISNYNNGVGSHGSINPLPYHDSLKYKLSQFINDGDGVSPFITQNTFTASTSGFSASQLEAINEGNGIGWRLKGRDANNYGNLGLNAVDFSVSISASTSKGATGLASFATGRDNTAFGIGSFVAGIDNLINGHSATAFGVGNTVNSYGEAVVGTYASILTGVTNSFITTAHAFRVGIGSATNSRKDGLRVGNSGAILAPEMSNDIISGSTDNKILITKDFLLSREGLIAIYQNGKSGYRLSNVNQANYGNIGQYAVDLSFSQSSGTTKGATGDFSFAFGYDTSVPGVNSAAMGTQNIVSGQTSIAIGSINQVKSNYSVAIGNYVVTNAANSIGIGDNITTINPNEIVLGRYSANYTGDTILRIGAGTSGTTNRDVFRVFNNGAVVAPQLTTAIISSGDNRTLVTKEYAFQILSGGTSGGSQNLQSVLNIGSMATINNDFSVTAPFLYLTGNGPNTGSKVAIQDDNTVEIKGVAGVYIAGHNLGNSISLHGNKNIYINSNSGTTNMFSSGDTTITSNNNIILDAEHVKVPEPSEPEDAVRLQDLASISVMTGGTYEFIGDGVTSVINFPHGFTSEPTAHVVSRNTDIHGNDFSSIADEEFIEVTFFNSAPDVGDKIILNWIALK